MILKIKEYREDVYMTQKELAEKIGNVQRNVSNWENGVNEPDCETIVKLAEIFDITLDELFGRSPMTKTNRKKIDFDLMKEMDKLSDTQKFTLLQFLKEMNN